MKLRKLNEQGLQTFRDFLRDARRGALRSAGPPTMLLTWTLTSEEVVGAPNLEDFSIPLNAFELARYLHEKLAHLDPVTIEGRQGQGDPGFWAAMSLFYFELLSPGYQENGGRVLADNCYVPELGTAEANLRYFRHRLAGSWRLFGLYGEACEALLLSEAGVRNQLYMKITDSVFYTETCCVVEAVNLLYLDRPNRRLKRNCNSKDTPGALPRLLAVVDQLDLTYDLQGISGAALVAQLPSEFDAWR